MAHRKIDDFVFRAMHLIFPVLMYFIYTAVLKTKCIALKTKELFFDVLLTKKNGYYYF
jgi:hypothetical protein